jgi:hypothetical protein
MKQVVRCDWMLCERCGNGWDLGFSFDGLLREKSWVIMYVVYTARSTQVSKATAQYLLTVRTTVMYIDYRSYCKSSYC